MYFLAAPKYIFIYLSINLEMNIWCTYNRRPEVHIQGLLQKEYCFILQYPRGTSSRNYLGYSNFADAQVPKLAFHVCSSASEDWTSHRSCITVAFIEKNSHCMELCSSNPSCSRGEPYIKRAIIFSKPCYVDLMPALIRTFFL